MTFESLAKTINGYLQEDIGIGLNFRGYRDVLNRYFRVEDNQPSELFDLMISCNLWYNYMVDIEALIAYKKEEWKLREDWLFAHEKKAEPSEELENQIQHARERTRHFKIFQSHVQSQQKMFAMASKHCQELYHKGIKSYSRIN